MKPKPPAVLPAGGLDRNSSGAGPLLTALEPSAVDTDSPVPGVEVSPREWGLGLSAPPIPAAAEQHQNPKQDQQAGPQYVPSDPTQQAEVLEQVVGTYQHQSSAPEPRPHTAAPRPRAVPAATPVIAKVVTLLVPPFPQLVACSSRTCRLSRLTRRRRHVARGLGGHRSDATPDPRCGEVRSPFAGGGPNIDTAFGRVAIDLGQLAR